MNWVKAKQALCVSEMACSQKVHALSANWIWKKCQVLQQPHKLKALHEQMKWLIKPIFALMLCLSTEMNTLLQVG